MLNEGCIMPQLICTQLLLWGRVYRMGMIKSVMMLHRWLVLQPWTCAVDFNYCCTAVESLPLPLICRMLQREMLLLPSLSSHFQSHILITAVLKYFKDVKLVSLILNEQLLCRISLSDTLFFVFFKIKKCKYYKHNLCTFVKSFLSKITGLPCMS